MIKKKVLVTGAGGYIGRHVVKTLLDMDMEVIAVDLNIDKIDKRSQIINYDIFNSAKDVYTELGRPDICLHLAWRDGFKHNSVSHINYLPKHFEFAQNLIAGGLTHFVALGSMHEIGYFEGAIDEKTPTNPRSLYGIAKNSLRQSLEVLKESNNFVFQWLRAYYIYGDDSSNNSIFTKILEASKNNAKMFPFTKGVNKYDFIEVEELAKQISATILQTEITGIINCCTGTPIMLKDIVEKYIEKNNLNISLEYGVYPERSYDSPATWGNNDKITTILKKYENISK